MSGQTSSALLLGIIAASFLHAILPTHWLPFVIIGRAQEWSHGKIFRTLILAGTGHITTTAILGLVAAGVSKFFLNFIEGFHFVFSAAFLAIFGLFYVISSLRKGGYPHCHHEHDSDKVDEGAVFSLFIMLSLSPCESAIPIYFAAGEFSWSFLIILMIASGIATLIGMFVFAKLALLGFERVRLHFIEHYERLIMGVILLSVAGILFLVNNDI